MPFAGEVYRVARRDTGGHEQRGPRPYVVVQTDAMAFLSTRLCVPTSTVAREADWRVPVQLEGEQTLALCEQVTAVTLGDLDRLVGRITASELHDIAARVKDLLWL